MHNEVYEFDNRSFDRKSRNAGGGSPQGDRDWIALEEIADRYYHGVCG